METEKNLTDFETAEKTIAQITVTAENGYINCHLDGETPFLIVAAANALCEVSICEKIPLPKLMWKIYGIVKHMKKKAPKCREEKPSEPVYSESPKGNSKEDNNDI